MAKRGRKKGGLNINKLDNREQITNMIINQINSLNKKIKSFKEEGISEHEEFIKNFLSNDLVKFNENGTIAKSKLFYEEKNMIWLKKSLSALHKINNHAYYGTVTKYKKEMTANLKGVKKYAIEHLEKKGYDQNFINNVTTSKEFFTKLFMEFSNGKKVYESDDTIDKVALTYGEPTGFTEEEMDKILSNIEYSRNTLDRLAEEKRELEEFRAMKNRKMR